MESLKKTSKRKLKIRKESTEKTCSETIKDIIAEETNIQDKIKKILSDVTPDENKLLGHLGEYIEEPYQIIESYFYDYYSKSY